jgi:hypothetical protein
MTSSVPTTDDFIDSFPIQPAKITGQPDYASLTALRNELKQNAASIPCDHGGGAHGYLGVTVSALLYETIALGNPFTIPAYSDAQPIIPHAATGAQISAILLRLYNENLRAFREYTNIHNALKKQLTDAIEPIYIRSQCHHHHVGYANRSLREILANLFQAYGQLTPQRLIDNQTAMHQPWDPNTPFETLIEQLEDGMELADATGQAYTNAQVLTLAYTLVYNTGLYFDECKQWKARAAPHKHGEISRLSSSTLRPNYDYNNKTPVPV